MPPAAGAVPSSTTPSATAGTGAVIGLDIGGTKTRGVRFEDGAPVADESVGSSNVQNVSPEEAAVNLAKSSARIGGGDVAQVYAGEGEKLILPEVIYAREG